MAAPPEMMPLAEGDLRECRRFEALRPVCPLQAPAARQDEGYGHRASSNRSGKGDEAAYLANIEWGAPYRNAVNERDRPPRFAHLVVMAGELDRVLGFDVSNPEEALGKRTWGGRAGELVLAPPYPRAGINGSHLVFLWEQGGTDYALALHAWEPLDEAEAALRETVLSIP